MAQDCNSKLLSRHGSSANAWKCEMRSAVSGSTSCRVKYVDPASTNDKGAKVNQLKSGRWIHNNTIPKCESTQKDGGSVECTWWIHIWRLSGQWLNIPIFRRGWLDSKRWSTPNLHDWDLQLSSAVQNLCIYNICVLQYAFTKKYIQIISRPVCMHLCFHFSCHLFQHQTNKQTNKQTKQTKQTKQPSNQATNQPTNKQTTKRNMFHHLRPGWP